MHPVINSNAVSSFVKAPLHLFSPSYLWISEFTWGWFRGLEKVAACNCSLVAHTLSPTPSPPPPPLCISHSITQQSFCKSLQDLGSDCVTFGSETVRGLLRVKARTTRILAPLPLVNAQPLTLQWWPFFV